MFAKSVVTRLLIFPTRFSPLELLSLSTSLGKFDTLSLPILEVLGTSLEELACKVSSREWRVSLSVSFGRLFRADSSSDDGKDRSTISFVFRDVVVGEVSALTPELALLSALNRIRSECSKMSWVMMHSARTSVRVYGPGLETIGKPRSFWTYRNVNVPLPCYSAYHGTCEKPDDPEPRTHDRVLAMCFEVSIAESL